MAERGGITLAPASEQDILDLLADLRDGDREEIERLSRSTPEAAVRWSIMRSDHAVTVRSPRGRIMCIYGFGSLSAVGEMAAPWMIGANEMFRHQITLVRKTQDVIQSVLKDKYRRLQNVVWEGNTASKRYLEAVGFTLGEVQTTPYGVEFRQFWAERDEDV